MKAETLIVLGAAAVGLFLVVRATRRPAAPAGAATTEVQNTANPGQEGYGWRYFSDGTAIGPDGSYYSNGLKIWSVT